MKITFFLAVFLVVILSSQFAESAECSHLIFRYFSCKNLNLSIEGPTESDPNEYFSLNGALDDNFFESKLSSVQSFGSAMNFFRRIYTELKNCSTDVCRCAKQRADGSHFDGIFTNSAHFGFLKMLSSQIKTKYRQRAFNRTEFEINFSEYPLTVSQFCYKYDFSISTLYYYNETSTCISQSISNVSKKCFDDNLESELVEHPQRRIDEIPTNKLETYTKCLLTHVECPLDVKRFLGVNMIANYPKIVKGNLETYIEHLLTPSEEFSPVLIG